MLLLGPGGRGSWPGLRRNAARRLEQTAAATGATHERIPRQRKLVAWWRPAPITAASHDQLAAAHRTVTRDVGRFDRLQPMPFMLTDLTNLFGLNKPFPHPTREVTALVGGAVLSGRLAVLAGHDAVIDTDDGPLVVDLRLIAGWTLTPTDEPASSLTTASFDPSGDHEQGTLF